MKFAILLLSCFLVLMASGQEYTLRNADSLERRFETAQGQEKAGILARLSLHYIHSNPKKGKQYAEEALKMAEKSGDVHAQGLANLCLGIASNQEGRFPSAMDLFLTAEKELETTDDYLMLGHVRREIAILNYFTGNFDGFRRWGLTIIDPYTKAHALSDLAMIYYGIGFYYNNFSPDFEKSIAYLRLADSIAVAANIRPALRGGILTSAGYAYELWGKYDSSLFYYQLALRQYDESHDTDYIFRTNTLLDMAGLYGLSGSKEKTVSIGREVYARSRKHMYLFGLGRSANILAKMFSAMDDPDRAEYWREEALKNFHLMDSVGDYFLEEKYRHLPGYWWEVNRILQPEEIRFEARKGIYSSLKWLSDFYERKGDFRNALFYEHRAIPVKDSLARYQQAKVLLGLQIRYETGKKEQEIDRLSQENQLHRMQLRRTTWLIAGLAIVILLIILFGLVWFRQNKLRDRQHALELEQRLLRAQMNPHFIFNSLASIQNFIVTQDPIKASTYLSRFSILVRNILDNSVEEFVTFEDEISTIENYLELQKVRYEGKFDFTIHADPGIDMSSMMIPPMLAQPFIENSIEHGFKQKETKGHLAVRFTLQNPSLILFEVEDDGIGRKKARELGQSADPRHRSLATSITRDRLAVLNRKLKQKIRLEITDLKDDAGNPSGTNVRFFIPVKS